MFTGLIEEVGTIAAFDSANQRLTVNAAQASRAIRRGDSVAVSGVCLTAVEVRRGKSFSADLAAETLERTSLGRLRAGACVNLELPIRAGTPLGGHIVQGHVDGVGELLSLTSAIPHDANHGARRDHDRWLRVQLPRGLSKYVVEKGSITLEGISLTVAEIAGAEVTVAIVPHTYRATNLHGLRPGDALNVEVDVLAKYAEKRSRSNITLKRLKAEGF